MIQKEKQLVEIVFSPLFYQTTGRKSTVLSDFHPKNRKEMDNKLTANLNDGYFWPTSSLIRLRFSTAHMASCVRSRRQNLLKILDR